MTEQMTKTERDDLAKLVRRREKLAKADVEVVAAVRLAEFEQQMASIYRPGDEAKAFLEAMPTAEALMPPVDFTEIEGRTRPHLRSLAADEASW